MADTLFWLQAMFVVHHELQSLVYPPKQIFPSWLLASHRHLISCVCISTEKTTFPNSTPACCMQRQQAASAITAGRHSGAAAVAGGLPPGCANTPCCSRCSGTAAGPAQHDILHAFLPHSLSHGVQGSGVTFCCLQK